MSPPNAKTPNLHKALTYQYQAFTPHHLLTRNSIDHGVDGAISDWEFTASESGSRSTDQAKVGGGGEVLDDVEGWWEVTGSKLAWLEI